MLLRFTINSLSNSVCGDIERCLFCAFIFLSRPITPNIVPKTSSHLPLHTPQDRSLEMPFYYSRYLHDRAIISLSNPE